MSNDTSTVSSQDIDPLKSPMPPSVRNVTPTEDPPQSQATTRRLRTTSMSSSDDEMHVVHDMVGETLYADALNRQLSKSNSTKCFLLDGKTLLFTMCLLLTLAVIINDEEEGRWKVSMPLAFVLYFFLTIRWNVVGSWLRSRLCSSKLVQPNRDLELTGRGRGVSHDSLDDADEMEDKLDMI